MFLASTYQPYQPFDAGAVWSGTPWLFTALGVVLGVACLPYCVRASARRDYTPILMWTGGLASGWIAEPILDNLGHIWWGAGFPGPTFTAFDLPIPGLIPPIYAFFTGILGYVGYRLFQRGITTRQIFLIWAALALVDLIVQFIGVSLRAYVYYGHQPFQFFQYPVLSSVKNGTAYLLIAIVVWAVLPHLRGWARVAFLLLMPVTGYLAGALGVAWPRYLSLAVDVPAPWAWALSAASVLLSLAAVRGMAAAAATDSNWRVDIVPAASTTSAM
jgi:hypothetical protein